MNLPLELWSNIYKYLNDCDRFKFGSCSKRCREIVYINGYKYLIIYPDNLHIIENILNQGIPINILDVHLQKVDIKNKKSRVKNLRLFRNVNLSSLIDSFNPIIVEKHEFTLEEKEILSKHSIQEKKPLYEKGFYKVFKYPGHFLSCHIRNRIETLQIKDTSSLKIFSNSSGLVVENINPNRDILEVCKYRIGAKGINFIGYKDQENKFHHPSQPAVTIFYPRSDVAVYTWYNHGIEYRREEHDRDIITKMEKFDSEGKYHCDIKEKEPSFYQRIWWEATEMKIYTWHDHGVKRIAVSKNLNSYVICVKLFDENEYLTEEDYSFISTRKLNDIPNYISYVIHDDDC